jgi:hypothetical protein
MELPHNVRTSSTEISKPALEITTVACYLSALCILTKLWAITLDGKTYMLDPNTSK